MCVEGAKLMQDKTAGAVAWVQVVAPSWPAVTVVTIIHNKKRKLCQFYISNLNGAVKYINYLGSRLSRTNFGISCVPNWESRPLPGSAHLCTSEYVWLSYTSNQLLFSHFYLQEPLTTSYRSWVFGRHFCESESNALPTSGENKWYYLLLMAKMWTLKVQKRESFVNLYLLPWAWQLPNK